MSKLGELYEEIRKKHNWDRVAEGYLTHTRDA